MRKLFLSFALLTLSVGLWAETVEYRYPVYNTDGVATSGIKEWQTGSVDATEVTNSGNVANWGTSGQTTWYIVTGEDVQLSNGAICEGDVHLIIADGAKLTTTGITLDKTTNKYIDSPGIQVSGEGNSLTIYGQAAQSGQLITNGGWYAAGIGGGESASGSNITINGGVVTANGEKYAAGIGGGMEGSGSNITINGGTVTAKGGYDGAGIGGGSEGSGSNITINGGIVIATSYDNGGAGIGGGKKGAGSNITINGGEVTASGGMFGAGIGGGGSNPGSNITISGGTVTANSGYWAAGIGGGDGMDGSNITINGGTVIANGSENSAGIGGGYKGSGFDITISGGVVTANSGSDGSGIGGGLKGSSSNIKVAISLIVKADNNNPPTTEIAADRTIDQDIAADLAGKRYATIESRPCFTVTYGDYITMSPDFASGAKFPVGFSITFTAADRTAEGFNFVGFYNESTFDTPITEGVSGQTYTFKMQDAEISVYAKYEATKQTITYGDYITVSPEFASGAEIPAGTQITFTVADRRETGYVFVGFYKEGTFDNQITEGVSGQTYTVTVATAAISVYAKYEQFAFPYIDVDGQQKYAEATIVTDNSEQVTWGTADATTWYVVKDADVQLSKGAVCQGNVNLILADDAKLTTTGEGNPIYTPGIKVSGDGNSLTIYGQTAQSGQLIAKSVGYAAGIGGGNGQDGSNITINGGIVTATGGEDAAGIGGGWTGNGSNITINGGIITANGGYAAGIGGGYSGNGSFITINGGITNATTRSNFAAGIGGGYTGSGSNITINGGTVTANGGEYAAGIGSGFESGAASNIKVNPSSFVRAGSNYPPTTIIAQTRTADTDIASDLAGKQYAKVVPSLATITVKTAPTKVNYLEGEHFDPAGLVITVIYGDNTTEDVVYSSYASNFSFSPALDAALQTSNSEVTITYLGQSCTQPITMFDRESVIAEIYAAMDGHEDSEYLNGLVATQITAIQNATTLAVVISNKEEAIALIQAALPAYKAGKAEAAAALPTEGTSGPAVIITKGEKSITLINPDDVTYKIIEEE